MGESTGAVLGLGAALRGSECVSGLCLINPATSYASSPLSIIAPLLPKLPSLPVVGSRIYEMAPAFVSPIFGKPDWFNPVVKPRLDAKQRERAAKASASLVPTLPDILAASEALASVLPPEALAWRLEAHLSAGAKEVNAALDALDAAPSGGSASEGGALSNTAALLLAGGRDLVLPSTREVGRLAARLPTSPECTVSKVLPQAAHACMDDERSLNLRLELELSGVLAHVQKRHAAMRQREPSAPVPPSQSSQSSPPSPPSQQAQQAQQAQQVQQVQQAAGAPLPDPAPQSLFEGWLGQMRRLFSPLFYAVTADGSIRRGLQQADLPDGQPLLLCGNHQLYGFDGCATKSARGTNFFHA